jgi:hypoxanthine phosphoribosyltransferase
MSEYTDKPGTPGVGAEDSRAKPPLANIDVLIDAERLRARVQELGEEIVRDFNGEEVILVGVLKGAFVFLADLARAIDSRVVIDFLGVSSYGASTKSTGVVKITRDLSWPLTGKNVVLVEDIVDTGLTMSYLLETLATRKPKSLKVCSLLYKPARAKAKPPIHYCGFTIEDRFVIGYGLDYDGRYRNLPYIGTCEEIPED